MKRDTASSVLRIGLIGDYSPQVRAHGAIPRALDLAADGHTIEAEWIATETLAGEVESRLAEFDALWCVPASPYRNMDGALCAIRFARERGVPFLGTCGGFQHALIEYARNVLGLSEADHAESRPQAAMPLIAPLSCSLVGAEGVIKLEDDSRVKTVYDANEITEQYHCNYGFNPKYRALLAEGALRVTGVDRRGEARIIELDDHPFFFATLFQPERSAFAGCKHPLIAAYVRAAAR